MEIGGGTNVPIKFRDANLCMLLLSHSWLICIWHSQEMDVHSFTIEKLDLNSPFKDIMDDKV